MPNLAQKYDPADASDYIIKMMPDDLYEAGQRVKFSAKVDGRYLDLKYLIRMCAAEVFEKQDAAPPKPVLSPPTCSVATRSSSSPCESAQACSCRAAVSPSPASAAAAAATRRGAQSVLIRMARASLTRTTINHRRHRSISTRIGGGT
jgi:hypothetical protein